MAMPVLSSAQITEKQLPFFGAQVFIEPGQSPEEIDGWFRTMKENNFSVCRIRMFESYMRNDSAGWNFTLFDHAFRSAERHGIKVYATLFPRTDKTDIGGFKFPSHDKHLAEIAYYIKETVTHFKSSPALRGWVLINEPGTGGDIPWNEFTRQRYKEWKKDHPQKEFTDKGYPVLLDLTDQVFLRYLNTWYLQWLANEIRKYDTGHELHVNNHAIFQNCAEYDFPAWRNFLTSLGGSAHASWHFGYFTRQQYAVAMSANSEIIRSGAGHLPWFMTELQGGNNTFSGFSPMCPTPDEITQWLWTIIASEAKGSIFWTLNPRSSGIEAGEWALLTFQNQPSERVKAIARVARTIQSHPEVFSSFQEAESGIHLLYIRESLWAERKLAVGSVQNYEGREPGGVMKSLLAYFEALSWMGINTSISAFEEFDFSQPDYTGTVIILAHQIAIPSAYASILERYVSKGGKLIVDGLTGFYDENLHNTMKTGFPFEQVFGGNISEFRLIDNLFDVPIGKLAVPAHLWQGYIIPSTGKVIAYAGNEPVAIRNKFGKGDVIWIPSLLGLGSRIKGNYGPLAAWLTEELKENFTSFPVRFRSLQKNVMMKTAKTKSGYFSVIINKENQPCRISLVFEEKNYAPSLLFSSGRGFLKKTNILIYPEETMVLLFRRK